MERKSPRLKGSKDRVIFTSTQGIHALKVSSATFYRHVRKLEMRPRRNYKSNARWWTYDDLLRPLNSVYPSGEERAELFFRRKWAIALGFVSLTCEEKFSMIASKKCLLILSSIILNVP